MWFRDRDDAALIVGIFVLFWRALAALRGGGYIIPLVVCDDEKRLLAEYFGTSQSSGTYHYQ